MFRRRRLCVNAAKVCTSCWYTQLVALGRIWISSTLLSQALKILGITLQHSKDFDLNSIWINSSFRKDAKENPHSDLNDQNLFHSTIDIWNAPRGARGVKNLDDQTEIHYGVGALWFSQNWRNCELAPSI